MMKLSVRRFIGITAIFSIFPLGTWHYFGRPTLAQEPAPFEISLTPQADFAVSGQPFVYTLTITNVSQTPSKDVIIKAKTPEGSVLADSYFTNPEWFVGGVQRGESGEVIWLTQQPVTPGEVITFDLVVNILPELVGHQLINDEYVVMTMNNNQVIASGPPIKTQVLSFPPTPSPVVPVAETIAPTVPPLSAQQLQTTPNLASSTPTPGASFVATSQANLGSAEDNESLPPEVAQNTTSATSSSVTTFAIIGLSGLLLFIVGLLWFRKQG
jgi:hypothetical protein